VVLGNDGFLGAFFDTTLADLRDAVGAVRILAIDMPIHLPSSGRNWPRSADLAARDLLGPRRNSVFLAPPAPVLECSSWEEANRHHRQLTGDGLSRQSWSLFPRIAEVQVLAAAVSGVHEVHPEVSFTVMAGGAPLPFAKRTWNGLTLRRRLLSGEGIDLPDRIEGPAGTVAPDDLLDAAAAAWTARRIATGRACVLGGGSSFGSHRAVIRA